MGRRHLLAIVMLAVAVLSAGCSVETSSRTAPRPRAAIVRDYRAAHATAARRISRATRGAESRAAPVRRAAARCLATWRAAPENDWEDLLDLYDVALAQPSLPAEIAGGRRWLRALDAIPDLDRVAHFADARRRLRRELAALQALHQIPIDLCATLTAWRTASWSTARRPSTLRTVQHTLKTQPKTPRDALLIDLGLPDARSYCNDPVFTTIDEGDTFCG